MNILAYTYDADFHCVDCAQDAFGRFGPVHHVVSNHGYGYTEVLSDGSTIELDENCIPLDEEDSEGNTIQPVFSFDEDEHCGDCLQAI